ncbi:MAG: hypothetical protein ACLUD4_00990 [Thomasclavelia spiroformis]
MEGPFDKSEARETMHYLIEKYDLDQEEVFRYGVVEKVTMATY